MRNPEKLLVVAFMSAIIGIIISKFIESPEAFKEFCESLDKKINPDKSFEQMTIKELSEIINQYVAVENYEKANEIKKIIDYRKQQNEDKTNKGGQEKT